VIPIALGLGGLLLRVAALAVVPRLAAAVQSPRRATPLPEPCAEPPAEVPAAVVAPGKVQKSPAVRLLSPGFSGYQSPLLQRSESPTEAQGPPFTLGRSRTWAYLHRRNSPINFVDPGGLEATIRFMDGTQFSTSSPVEFGDRLTQALPGTLDFIRLRGHGSDTGDAMGFDPNDEAAPGLILFNRGPSSRIYLNEGGKVKANRELGKLLEGKFSRKGESRIYLDACDTADPNGLTQNLARILRGIRVRGVAGTLLEHKITGSERPASSSGGVYEFRSTPVVEGNQGPLPPGIFNGYPW